MPIRVGLMGCGGISSTHISAAKALGYARIVAVCDVVAERATRKAAQLGLPEAKCYIDYRDLLADGDVDCVIIGTPHYHHATAAVDAARAGKHVLTEKPMATTVADCTAMIDAAETAGVILGVAAGTAQGMESVISNGAYDSMVQAAKQGRLTDDVVFDASVDAAIDTGNAGAFYGINSGWQWSQIWNSIKNWFTGN